MLSSEKGTLSVRKYISMEEQWKTLWEDILTQCFFSCNDQLCHARFLIMPWVLEYRLFLYHACCMNTESNIP